MENYIGIYDRDPVYARRLMEGIVKRMGESHLTVEFTKAENVALFTKKHYLRTLLIAWDEFTPDMKGINVGEVIGLCEERPSKEEAAAAGEAGVRLIYKYRTLTELLLEIRGRDDPSLGINEKKSIAVYSPVHRCGATLFSVALSRIMGERVPTLLISLEEYSPLKTYFCPDSEGSVADAVYYNTQGFLKEKEREIVASAGRFDFLCPPELPEDIKSLSGEEINSLVRYFLEESGYAAVIVDMGSLIPADALACFDKVMIPVLEGRGEEEKLRAFYRHLSTAGISLQSHEEVRPPFAAWPGAGEITFSAEYEEYIRKYL